jgi:hypothetical protein
VVENADAACTTASTMSVTKAANRTIPLLSNRMLLSGSGFVNSSLRLLSSGALQFPSTLEATKSGRETEYPYKVSIYGSSCRYEQ